MTGIITVQGVALPTTLPKATYDALIVGGTLGVWDAGNPKSWASQAAPVAGTQSLRNLAQDALHGDVGLDWTWDAARKALVRPAATSARIALGNPVLSDVPRSAAGTVWVHLPAVPAALSPLMGRLNTTGAVADNQFSVGIGADGKPRADTISLDTDGTTLRYIAAFGPSVITTGWHQLGWSITYAAGNSATTALFLDGTQIGTSPYIGARLNPSTLGIALGNRHASATNGSLAGVGYLRAALEDLTASGRSAATFVARDWTLNRARVGL